MPERVAREVRLPRVLVQDSWMGLKERRDRRPGNGAEGRPEGVDLGQRQAIGLDIELPRHRQGRS